jgi:hypothetical protein
MADKAKKQIASPNWPNEYSPETDKFVCVQANTGKRVHLDLIWLDMETGCGHSCDYIKVSSEKFSIRAIYRNFSSITELQDGFP